MCALISDISVHMHLWHWGYDSVWCPSARVSDPTADCGISHRETYANPRFKAHELSCDFNLPGGHVTQVLQHWLSVIEQIEQHYEQLNSLRWRAREGEKEREREREGERESIWKYCFLQLFWSLLAMCVERFILALGRVGSWQEAWKLFKRYDLNNDDILSPPLPQDLSIGSFIQWHMIWVHVDSTSFHQFCQELGLSRKSQSSFNNSYVSHLSHQHFVWLLSRYEFQLLLRHVLRDRFPSAKDVPRELFKELLLMHACTPLPVWD